MKKHLVTQSDQVNQAIFIHGAFCGTDYQYFMRPLDKNGGFKSLDKYFESGQAKLYYWPKDRRKFKFYSILNPFNILQSYLIDRAFTSDSKSLAKLDNLIQQTQPTKIVAHSLGTRKIANYLKYYDFPDSVREIYFLAAEVSEKELLATPKLYNLVTKGNLKIYNYHCWWDQALLCATAIFRQKSMGLNKSQSQYIQDVFYPLDFRGNPHNSHFRDQNLAYKIMHQ